MTIPSFDKLPFSNEKASTSIAKILIQKFAFIRGLAEDDMRAIEQTGFSRKHNTRKLTSSLYLLSCDDFYLRIIQKTFLRIF